MICLTLYNESVIFKRLLSSPSLFMFKNVHLTFFRNVTKPCQNILNSLRIWTAVCVLFSVHTF